MPDTVASIVQPSVAKGWAADRNFHRWVLIFLFIGACLLLKNGYPVLKTFPVGLTLPVTDWINWFTELLVATVKPFFRAITWLMNHPMSWARDLLHWFPWPAFILLVGLVSYSAGGWRLALFSSCSLAYMLVIGFWEESMNSLALVTISVPLAVLVGFVFGVLGYFSRRAERMIMPCLDILQTIPAFAYLLPILVLFGFGPVVGLTASVLYSFAPMVRNTILGLRSIPSDVVESGVMSGATSAQLFWQVRIPTAKRQLLLGINQTTMASLSMVIIASIIGGTNDIGWAILSTLRKAQFGESLLAGIVIAIIAMILDRITWGIANREPEISTTEAWYQKYRYWILATIAVMVVAILGNFVSALLEYPEAWVIDLAAPINDSISWIVVNFQAVINAIKQTSLFYVMLPLKIGLMKTVSPFTWGFVWTTVHTVLYFVVAGLIALYVLQKFNHRFAVAFALVATFYFVGLTEMPWPTLVVIIVALGYQLGGVRLAAGVFAGLAFLLISGSWEKTVLSLYLCGIAVIVAFVGGSSLGIWGAHNKHVSRIMRPINDTLQTMPLFVILIPIVMIFKLGEFTALWAIVAYAYVPAYRYSEHGIKTVPEEVIEAARAMGCTPAQLLLQVKLPLAIPNIMLGLNQTIMYALAMLVIAALVGTTGLGQQVYIGLGKADVGIGLVAGAGMALIAIISDRLCQAAKRKFEAKLSN